MKSGLIFKGGIRLGFPCRKTPAVAIRYMCYILFANTALLPALAHVAESACQNLAAFASHWARFSSTEGRFFVIVLLIIFPPAHHRKC